MYNPQGKKTSRYQLLAVFGATKKTKKVSIVNQFLHVFPRLFSCFPKGFYFFPRASSQSSSYSQAQDVTFGWVFVAPSLQVSRP